MAIKRHQKSLGIREGWLGLQSYNADDGGGGFGGQG